MHEPSKVHDAQQNSGEPASPETLYEGSCTLETPRDGSSIAPRHIVVDSRFHQDFTYQEDLGKGSYGIVEECKHKLDMRRYAIKQITPKEGKSSLTLAKNEVRFEFSFLVS
jgi:serine/threonine protein kinase